MFITKICEPTKHCSCALWYQWQHWETFMSYSGKFHLHELIQKGLKLSPCNINHRHLWLLYTTSYRLTFAMLCLSPKKKIHAAFSEFPQNQYCSLTKNFRYPFQMCKFSLKILSGILTLDFLPHHLDPTMWNHLQLRVVCRAITQHPAA